VLFFIVNLSLKLFIGPDEKIYCHIIPNGFMLFGEKSKE